MANKEKYNFKQSLKKAFYNASWLFFISMGIESFVIGIPYTISIGFMFVFYSLFVFPWRDKIYKLLKIDLTKKQKWFIVFGIFFITAYLIKPEETNYLWCILSLILMFMVYVLVILYSKKKSKKVHK